MAAIHLYAFCLNERRMLPFFFRHYAALVDRFIIYDNGSTDGSLDLLRGDERVELRHFTTEGDSFGDVSRRLMDNCWKDSRGRADWVITAEVDEHLHHPDLRAYLAHCRAADINVLTAVGYDMHAEDFPQGDAPLSAQVRRGVRNRDFDKMAIFDPSEVTETLYLVGRHAADPQGRVVREPAPQVLLLHFKNLGVEYVSARNATLAQGLRPRDIAAGIGKHYLRSREQVAHDLRHLHVAARRVPGLAPQDEPPDPRDVTFEDELLVIEQSGLFDPADYLRRNPDVAQAQQPPLAHFCTYGWRENRWPNALFDTSWYRATYGRHLPETVNPLLDYILLGEAAERQPCPAFNPTLHRHRHRLPPGTPALRHRLATPPG